MLFLKLVLSAFFLTLILIGGLSSDFLARGLWDSINLKVVIHSLVGCLSWFLSIFLYSLNTLFLGYGSGITVG